MGGPMDKNRRSSRQRSALWVHAGSGGDRFRDIVSNLKVIEHYGYNNCRTYFTHIAMSFMSTADPSRFFSRQTREDRPTARRPQKYPQRFHRIEAFPFRHSKLYFYMKK